MGINVHSELTIQEENIRWSLITFILLIDNSLNLNYAVIKIWKYFNDNFYICSSKIIIHQYLDPMNLTALSQVNLLPFIYILCILIL